MLLFRGMHKMRLKFLTLIATTAFLAACEPTVASRGNILDPDRLAEVKTGTSTREDVATKLGTPTVVSTFDDKIWYYVGRQTEQYSFFDPKVIKQQAIKVTFDEQGVVSAVDQLDLSEAHDVETVDRATPTFGNDDTLIKQLLGNLSHPMPGGTSQTPTGNTH
jgi:outer membrane protein assembly factor BamE (lipoprotein component of BamABCDE complex)